MKLRILLSVIALLLAFWGVIWQARTSSTVKLRFGILILAALLDLVVLTSLTLYPVLTTWL
jgi:hypothetical protein